MYKSCSSQKQTSNQGKAKHRYPKPTNLVNFKGLKGENENWVILG